MVGSTDARGKIGADAVNVVARGVGVAAVGRSTRACSTRPGQIVFEMVGSTHARGEMGADAVDVVACGVGVAALANIATVSSALHDQGSIFQMTRATHTLCKRVAGDGLAAIDVAASGVRYARGEAGKVLVKAARCGAIRRGAARYVKVDRACNDDLIAGAACYGVGGGFVRVGHFRCAARSGSAAVISVAVCSGTQGVRGGH